MNTINSKDLINKYDEIAQYCKKSKEAAYIDVNGNHDLVMMDIDVYNQLNEKLNLLTKLLEAENDIDIGAVKEICFTFEDLRNKLK